jgi:hypothetical protein
MTLDKQLIALWKKLKLVKLVVHYNMSGDSGELSEIIGYKVEKGEEKEFYLNDPGIVEDWVYANCSFQENSDGVYNGHSGEITFTENKEENCIDWDMTSEENYSERKFETFTKKCTPYYSENIVRIEKSGWDNSSEIEYAPDFKAIDIAELESFVEKLEEEAKVKYESDDERYEQLNITFTDDTAHIEVVLSYDSYVPGDGDSGSIKLN